MWWCTVPWSRSLLKWPCLANFCLFHRTLKFSMACLDQVWGRMLPLLLFKDLSYQPEIWWSDVLYHEADQHWKRTCLDSFRVLDETSTIGLDQVWRKMTHIRKCEETTLWPEIWWHDATYHEADHYLKWPCSDNVCIFCFWTAKGAVVLWMACYSQYHFRCLQVFYVNTSFT